MQTIKLDISAKNNVQPIYVKQRDVGHKFAIELYENGMPYSVDDENTFAVWYSGASGDGNYTNIGDETAVIVDRNHIKVQMIMQMLNEPGGHEMCVVMYGQDNEQKGFWNIPYCVEAIPGIDSEVATEHYDALFAAQKKAEEAAAQADASMSIAVGAAEQAESASERAEAAAERAEAGAGASIIVSLDEGNMATHTALEIYNAMQNHQIVVFRYEPRAASPQLIPIRLSTPSKAVFSKTGYPTEFDIFDIEIDGNGQVSYNTYFSANLVNRAVEKVETEIAPVSYLPQTLAPEQQAQARENIGAVASEDIIAEYPQIAQTSQGGYMNTGGSYSGADAYHSISTQKVPCKEGDVFIYTGRGEASAQSWLFYNNDTIVSSGKHTGTTDVEIPAGVNFVKFSSYSEVGKDATLEVYKKTLPQTEELMEFAEGFGDMDAQMAIYRAYEESGYYGSGGNRTEDAAFHCMVTEKIPCKPGDAFIYKGFGYKSAYSWFFYNDNTLVSRGQYDGETVVIVPNGVNYVKFTSYAEATEDIRFEVYKKNSPQVKKLYEMLDKANQSNVLYGKKYVAVGDSFTEGDFTGFVDENGLSGKNSPVIYDSAQKMYKTYPWWIATRNSMTLVNEGKCGGIMPLSKAYLDGEAGVAITNRNPYSNERYMSVPEDADYLTIWFGINDSSTTNLGTADDTTNETFYGAYNVVLGWLLVNRPALKIGLIVTTGANASYRQAVRDIGKRWGVPVLDMMGDETPVLFGKEEGLCDAAAQIYRDKFQVSETNGHPNVLAHENMSTYIEAFLRRL